MSEMTDEEVKALVERAIDSAVEPVHRELVAIRTQLVTMNNSVSHNSHWIRERELQLAREEGERDGRSQTLVTKGQLAVLASLVAIASGVASVIGAVAVQQ